MEVNYWSCRIRGYFFQRLIFKHTFLGECCCARRWPVTWTSALSYLPEIRDTAHREHQQPRQEKSVQFDFCSSTNQKNEEIPNLFPAADTTCRENHRNTEEVTTRLQPHTCKQQARHRGLKTPPYHKQQQTRVPALISMLTRSSAKSKLDFLAREFISQT